MLKAVILGGGVRRRWDLEVSAPAVVRSERVQNRFYLQPVGDWS